MLKIETIGDIEDDDEIYGGVDFNENKNNNYRGAGGDDLSDPDEDFEPGEREKEDTVASRRKEAENIYGSAEDVSRPVGGETWDDFFAEAGTYTITKLSAGVKNPNRVNVFLDGHFAFSLDIAQVVELNVKVKERVDADRLKILQGASEFGKLYQRTLEWSLARPHSIREAKTYLQRRKFKRKMLNKQREREGKRALPEFEDDTLSLVLDRMIEKGYLDDAKFAKFYVENRYVRRGISQKRLRMELMKKGVAPELIDMALEEVDRPENDELMKVIRKKRKKYDNFRLIAYLARQGFDFNRAREAVENYKPEEDEMI